MKLEGSLSWLGLAHWLAGLTWSRKVWNGEAHKLLDYYKKKEVEEKLNSKSA